MKFLLTWALSILASVTANPFGVDVARFQEGGFFSSGSYLRYGGGLRRSLKDFTLCARLNINFLRSETNFWFSMGSDDNSELLSGAFISDDDGDRVVVRKYNRRFDDEITVRPRPGDDFFGHWHHFCFVYQSFPQLLGDKMNLTTKVYVDGVFVKEEHRVIKESDYFTIPRDADIILGQKHVPYTGKPEKFDASKSFSGSIAQLSMWRGEIVAEEVRSLSNCKTISREQIVIEWKASRFKVGPDGVRMEDVRPAAQLCREDDTRGLALFNNGAPKKGFKFFCDKLGGRLPVFRNETERAEKYALIEGAFRASFENISCLLEPAEQSKSTSAALFVWTGIVEDTASEGKDVFLDEYSGLPIEYDANLWPGPISEDVACTMTRGPNHLAKEKCDSILPCGVCEHDPSSRRLTLKGLCFDELKKGGDFDTEYAVQGLYNERVHFRGRRASHIFFDTSDNRWTLQSLKNPRRMSKLPSNNASDNFPIGRLVWTVQNADNDTAGICNLTNGALHLLTLSDCHPDGFTCTSGECVGLEKKCDALVDCGDGSDEEDCEFLVAADRYEKQSLPEALEEGDKVRVFFSIRISAFPEVDSAAFRVRSEYDLSLRWYDPRLRFRDLNNLTEFNDLGESDRTYLWSPRLEIPNALGVGSGSGDRKGGARAGGERLVDEAASLRLIKEDLEPLAEDFSLDREAKVFSGKTNSIELTKKYSQQHACKFELYYFPFDAQVCNLIFQLRDKTEDFLIFSPDNSPVIYNGERELSQYTLEAEDLKISRSPETNYSTAYVRVVLRHRIESHVVNSFVQTLIVLLVALATFFFDLDDFSDRIMVNAVLLLAMATITSSIQEKLPATANSKIIDSWLLFCVVMIVVSIVLHTVIGLLYKGARRNKGEAVRYDEEEDNTVARFANIGCIVVFLLTIIVFNAAFWVIALAEYNTASEELLEKKPIK